MENSSDGSSSFKGGKEKKGKPKCGYCNRGSHPKLAYMKKQIDFMARVLQKHDI
jgi:hypothetical protein